MAQSSNISFRMDPILKEQFSKFCEEMGITMSAAFNMFAKKTVRDQRIPFELSVDPFYSKESIADLERRIEDLKSGRSTLKEHELIEDE